MMVEMDGDGRIVRMGRVQSLYNKRTPSPPPLPPPPPPPPPQQWIDCVAVIRQAPPLPQITHPERLKERFFPQAITEPFTMNSRLLKDIVLYLALPPLQVLALFTFNTFKLCCIFLCIFSTFRIFFIRYVGCSLGFKQMLYLLYANCRL